MKSRSKLSILAIIYAAACLALAWWLIPQPQLTNDFAVPEQAWELPDVPVRPIDQAHTYLLKESPWGSEGSATVPTEASTSSSWRLRGIVREGQHLFVLAEIDNRVMRFERGQTLPGNQQLVRIEADRVVVTTDAGEIIVQLYPAEAEVR